MKSCCAKKSKESLRLSFKSVTVHVLLFVCIMGNCCHYYHHLSLSFPLVHGLLLLSAANNNVSPRKNPLPPPPSSNKNNYYSYKTFKRLTVPALIYSVVAKATIRILRLQPNTIPIISNSSSTSSSSFTALPLHHHCRRVAIVTGSNTGVGFETAKSLVQEHGMEVIIACRTMENGMEACKIINESSPPPGADASFGMAVFVEPLDLADLSSVRRFGKAVMEQYEMIDVLVNNAGRNSAGSSGDASYNNDSRDDNDNNNHPSLDIIFTTNFLGHFLLTNLLLKQCQRIVNLASVMHHFPYSNDNSNADVNSIEYWRSVAINAKCDINDSTSSVRKTYGPSKLAALLFSIELNRRYGESTGIRSIAVNPGAVNSDIWRNYPSYMKRLYRLLYLTAKQGSSTSVAAAVLDDFSPETIYLQPYRLPPFQNRNNNKKSKATPRAPFPIFEMLGPYAGYVETNPRLPDDGGAKACECLFTVCEELTGCKYE